MAGLRERQKADRERRILRAASTLFRDVGYDLARIDDIAAAAEVSPGTVYNYYQNKGDLLVAIVAMEVNEVLHAGEALIADPPRDVEEAVNALIGIYLDHSLVYLSKEMWRHAMAIATSQPDTPYGAHYNHLDDCLAEQVSELIARLKVAGRVGVLVDSRSVGELVFNNANMMFMVFVKTHGMTLHTLKSTIARQIRPLAAAIRL
jgi:AcrR family transcriptional regulator